MATEINGKAGHGIGHARILHGPADGKRRSNGDEDVPRNKFGVLTGREHIEPGHENGNETDTEKHVELDAGKGMLHGRKLAQRGTHNHDGQQHDGKPPFPQRHFDFGLLPVGHHEEERRIAPVLHKGVVGQQHKRVAFVKTFAAHIVHYHRFAAASQLQHQRSVFLFKIKVDDAFVDGGKSRAQHDFYAVKSFVALRLNGLII